MKTTNRLINLFAAILTTATLMADVVYEPLIVDSGFNRDIIMEKGGTAVSYLKDGIAYWYFATDSVIKANCIEKGRYTNDTATFNRVVRSGWPADYREAIRCTKDGDVYNNDLYKDVYWQLAPYNEPNALCIRPDKPELGGVGTIKFKKVGSYERIYILLASAKEKDPDKREVIARMYYTDGEIVQDTFAFAGLSGATGHKVRFVNILESGGYYAKNTTSLNAFASVFHMDVEKDKLIHRIEFENEKEGSSVIILGVTGVTADVEIPKEEAAQTSNIQETSFEACWEYIADAASYRLDVAEDIDFQHLVEGYNNLNVGNTTCQEVAGLLANNDYYWRVRSVNADGGQSASSAPRRVKTAGGDTPATDEVHTDIKAELDAWLDMTVSQITIDRTLYRDGAYNTLCLPFSLSEDEIAASPLTGAQIYKFVRAEKVSDAQLNIEVEDTTGIKAGVPYLIKWAPASPEIIDGGHLTFHNVYIRTTDGQTIGGTGEVQFVGNIARKTMEYEDYDNLFIGANNTLYWPNTTNPLRGFRAYFQVPKLGANAVARNTPARIIERHETATGMEQMTNDKLPITQKIIKDNQIYILHNGTMYNVQGQVVK